MKTVRDLFKDISAQAGSSGVCSETDLMRRMNIVGPELLDEIDAKGTLWTWCIPVCGNCIVLPTDVQRVYQAGVCGRPLAIKSEYWSGRITGNAWDDSYDCIPWENLTELNRSASTHWPVQPVALNEIFAVQAKKEADTGLEVEVRWRTGAGKACSGKVKLQGGQVMTQVSPDPAGEVEWLHKPRTAGNVVLWVVNGSTGASRQVSSYDPREETPEYKMMILPGCHGCQEMTIRGKRKWIDLRDPEDLVPFGRVMTWRNALMAEAASEEGKLQDRDNYLAAAVRDLDREKRGWESPNKQRGIQIGSPWTVGAGSANLGHRGFRG